MGSWNSGPMSRDGSAPTSGVAPGSRMSGVLSMSPHVMSGEAPATTEPSGPIVGSPDPGSIDGVMGTKVKPSLPILDPPVT